MSRYMSPEQNHILPPNWNEPTWAMAQKTHDWMNYISEEMRELWPTFNEAQKKAIVRSAEERADSEVWD